LFQEAAEERSACGARDVQEEEHVLWIWLQGTACTLQANQLLVFLNELLHIMLAGQMKSLPIHGQALVVLLVGLPSARTAQHGQASVASRQHHILL
jgi:hypothetical protein